MSLRIVLLLLASTFALGVGAQTAPAAPEEADEVERALALERSEAELESARARLEAAAREVARLSAEIVGPEVEEVVRRIRIGGRRAMLGISVEEADRGVLVAGVTPNGPADEAGLESGDVIININGVDVASRDGVQRLVNEMRNVEPGDAVPLTFRRGDDERTADVTATAFSARDYVFAYGGDEDPNVIIERQGDFDVRFGPGWRRMLHMGRWADMELVALTPGLGSYFGTEEGLLVVRAPEDESLQLEDGDVILKIGDRRPKDTGHAMRILRSFEAGETLALEIMRNKRQRTLKIEITDEEKVSRR